jgi:hypothetical protein
MDPFATIAVILTFFAPVVICIAFQIVEGPGTAREDA